jgi:DNA-binding response OmpR family regulator
MSLDTATVELRSDGTVRPVEPQVFRLLALLAENRERMVSRHEIIEKVCDGRIVSDAAIASRVKSARQALGDDERAGALELARHQGVEFLAGRDLRIPPDRPSFGFERCLPVARRTQPSYLKDSDTRAR